MSGRSSLQRVHLEQEDMSRLWIIFTAGSCRTRGLVYLDLVFSDNPQQQN